MDLVETHVKIMGKNRIEPADTSTYIFVSLDQALVEPATFLTLSELSHSCTSQTRVLPSLFSFFYASRKEMGTKKDIT